MPANWRSINRFSAMSAVALAAMTLAPSAIADVTGGGPAPTFLMTWNASNDNLPDDVPNPYNPGDYGSMEFGTFHLGSTQPGAPGGPDRWRTGWRYQGGLENSAWNLTWDCVVNSDPFVDATINVTNNTLAVQTFWVTMPLAIAPSIPDNTLMNGSVSAVLTSNSIFGATMSANGTNPVYQAYIDNNVVATMWDPGFTLTAGAFNSNFANNGFSNTLGPAANSSIKIYLRFDLSPGDSASITGTFEITPVPGPAGLSLLAVSGLLGGRRRRA